MTNVLAYNDTELITDIKSFIVQAPGGLSQSEAPCGTPLRLALALPTNIKLEWKLLTMTIALAYNDTELITDVKCFKVQTSGGLPQSGVRNVTLLRLALALPTTIKQEWKLLE
jgi:hypothetical protein